MGDSPLARVLVVHQEESVVRMMRECFIANGEVFHIERLPHVHVGAALDAIDERRQHLLLIASSLRLADGFGAMHAIRRHPRGQALPVLVLSDDPGGTDARLALAAGADAYLPMPDSVPDYASLAEKMRAMLIVDAQRR